MPCHAHELQGVFAEIKLCCYFLFYFHKFKMQNYILAFVNKNVTCCECMAPTMDITSLDHFSMGHITISYSNMDNI